jgi:hypothetical protein
MSGPALLCVSQSFPPATTPTAIRAGKLLERLGATWEVAVITETPGGHGVSPVRTELVRSWRPTRLLASLRRLRLDKLLELLVWPDESIFWVIPAILSGRRLVKELAPDAIVVFMMPYSSGLAGLALSRLTGLPLILNLDDSPTCTDMHPYFPTRLHYRLAKALEDAYVRRADAVVYVSATNLEAVRARVPERDREKLHLVRYGADSLPARPQPARGDDFEVVYVGAMSGWWTLIAEQPQSWPKRVYRGWARLGRYSLATLDQRTSSPAILGGAILDAIEAHADWAGRVKLAIYGNPYSASVVARALESAGVDSVVEVFDPVPHEQVAALLAGADLLFLTLPRRVDGSRGGRISAKTYEYLMSDRPILAAVPRGENWDYLEGRPGVWLVEPDDRRLMQEVVAELACAKFAGEARAFDREGLREELSYDGRAAEFDGVVRAAIARRERPPAVRR